MFENVLMWYMDGPIENISKKREDDLDMYLRLASDSRTMFKQGLKEARIQEKNWNIDIHSDMTWNYIWQFN